MFQDSLPAGLRDEADDAAEQLRLHLNDELSRSKTSFFDVHGNGLKFEVSAPYNFEESDVSDNDRYGIELRIPQLCALIDCRGDVAAQAREKLREAGELLIKLSGLKLEVQPAGV